MRYDVTQDVFEGPLGLLVELAKHNLLDVFLLKLRDLTAQYLGMVTGGQTSLNDLAEPLPLLGQLVALKAKLLLPQPLPVEEEEPPVSLEALQARLAEYERFKSVSQVLAQLHSLQHEYFSRVSQAGEEPVDRLAGVDDARLSASPGSKEVGLIDLMTAFTKVLDRAKAPVYEVVQEPWTVEMKVQELRTLLTVRHEVTFMELFSGDKTKLELVVTFLALLELVRQRICHAVQERHFGDILIVRREAVEANTKA